MENSPAWKEIPTNDQLVDPVYKAIVALGGSGTNQEIYEYVKNDLRLSENALNISHLGSRTVTELQYRIAWAKTKLKKMGRIDNSRKNGIWSIVSNITLSDTVSDTTQISDDLIDENTVIEGAEDWRENLSQVLINMNPYGFEVLAQRLLRESGFESVHVTKKSGDGGIDGFGKLKVNGIFCFNVAFQCKRYKTSVVASDIRDFRGSLSKSMEKGVFITTGTFTDAAIREAEDPGKQQIDLIDGATLIEMMKDLKIGLIETYAVDKSYFETLEKI